MDDPALQTWRHEWPEEEITWQESRRPWRDQRAQEREIRRRTRIRRDRTYFGQQAYGVTETQRKAVAADAPPAALAPGKSMLPLANEWELAEWLNIPLSRLRWYTHDKAAEPVWHYIRYTRPKRSGGTRTILAPKRELKAIQRQILHALLSRYAPPEAAHGFIPERSIVSNAAPHTGKAFVLKMDLADFFPSITYPRVRGWFINAAGYSFPVASALALLCTEYDREPFTHDGKTYHVSIGPRHLVQGAPTSPALANHIAYKLDTRLSALAAKSSFAYTRYADDLTFSGDDYDAAIRLMDVARRIITDENFIVNADKTRLMRQSTRQMVTGIVVNEKTSTPRQIRRQVRAILYNAQKTGLQAQNRDGHQNLRAYLRGLIGFINQTHPEIAQEFTKQLSTLPD